VHTGFIFEFAVDAIAMNVDDYFLIAAEFRVAGTYNLGFPTLFVGIF